VAIILSLHKCAPALIQMANAVTNKICSIFVCRTTVCMGGRWCIHIPVRVFFAGNFQTIRLDIYAYIPLCGEIKLDEKEAYFVCCMMSRGWKQACITWDENRKGGFADTDVVFADDDE